MTQLTLREETIALQIAFKEIHFYRGVAPRKAYEVLTKHQHEATPHLIQQLSNCIQRHDRTGNYYVAHIHALLLLSQFREKKTYPLVLDLLNLPTHSIDRLLGDMLTETMPKILLSVYDGNPDPLFSILSNHEADETLRSIIASCLSALIYQKMLEEEFVLLRLQEIVASGKMNGDQGFFSALAYITVECKLAPLYDTVRAAFNLGMVSSYAMDYFEQGLSKPIDELMREEDLNPLTDAANEIAKWYDREPLIPVIERNTPCPCGSGRKFKKCCNCYL